MCKYPSYAVLCCIHVEYNTDRVYPDCMLLQDGHEICFVGDEAFRELSKVDPNADKLMNEVGC